MEVLSAIFGRRSIRTYTDESVSESDIEVLLKAAMAAPTARKSREMRYIIVDDRSILGRIGELCPNAGMAANAPLGIVVCADHKAEIAPGYWQQNCAAAIENMLIAAHGIGLGAVWTGIYPREERVKIYTELFNMPENITPLGFVVVGHPAEHKSPNDIYEREYVFRNTWGSR